MAKGGPGRDPDFVQLLNPDGERVEHPEYSVEFTPDEYRGLYRDLVTVRKLDAEATALQRQGELGIWASLLGQEAAQVGSGRALRPQDMAFPTYREHGVLYTRGIDPIMPLGLFRGVDQGGWDSQAHKFHMYTIVIGAQTLHATGYAMGITMDGKVGTDEGEAVIAYFGDGASSQGDVNEAFVYSSVFNAPVVFFCQNNQYAISEPLERQTRVPLSQGLTTFIVEPASDGDRLPSATLIDLALGKRFQLSQGLELKLDAQVFNLLNDDSPQYWETLILAPGDGYTQSDWVLPRRLVLRVGLEF